MHTYTIDFYKFGGDKFMDLETVEAADRPHFDKRLLEITKLNADYYASIYPGENIYFLVYRDCGKTRLPSPILYGSAWWCGGYRRFWLARWEHSAGEYRREGRGHV